MNTIGFSRSLSSFITSVVKFSQPRPWWLRCAVSSHGQDGIEQQNAFLRPFREVTMLAKIINAYIVADLLENIHE